ncbi:hypothetical protein MY9_1300 [Bacillus sp. JS]|nr:hypothetical protein MY9_1300 [Bacillus sp. JS]
MVEKCNRKTKKSYLKETLKGPHFKRAFLYYFNFAFVAGS